MTIKKTTLYTAISVVIANMIGTGVFTSLGFQLAGIQSVFAIMMLWIVGGFIALCGALSYGELASAMPRSGGEYHYLSVILHPFAGFLSGWVSVTVGFAAPVALSAMALGIYVQKVYTAVNPAMLACLVVVAATVLHCFTLKGSARFQNISTLIKVVLIVVFIIAGFLLTTHQSISLLPTCSPIKSQSWTSIFSSDFAVSLIYVAYAYSGWNATAYMAGDIENPVKNVPKSFVIGTLAVTVLYVLLNFVFLYSAPVDALKNQPEVGYISGIHIFGLKGGSLVSLMIAALMISSVSAMVFAGPRVSKVMGEDIKPLRVLAKTNKQNIPVTAIIIQSSVTLFLILTSTFDVVLRYIGFTLSLFTFLTVLSLFVMRIKRKDLQGTYKTFGYPVTPIIFLLLTGWTLWFMITTHTQESVWGFATIFAGSIIYFIQKKR